MALIVDDKRINKLDLNMKTKCLFIHSTNATVAGRGHHIKIIVDREKADK